MGRTKHTKRKAPLLLRKLWEEEDEDYGIARCDVCHGNMESFKEKKKGSIGDTCPPCQRDLKPSIATRNGLKEGYGLLVPDDESDPIVRGDPHKREFIELKDALMGDEDGVNAKMGYSDRAVDPLYIMVILADPYKIDYFPNNRAERIAMAMNIFDLDEDKPILGPVLFLGPEGSPLTQREVDAFVFAASLPTE